MITLSWQTLGFANCILGGCSRKMVCWATNCHTKHSVLRQFVPVLTNGKLIAVNFAHDFQKKEQNGR